MLLSSITNPISGSATKLLQKDIGNHYVTDSRDFPCLPNRNSFSAWTSDKNPAWQIGL